MQFHVTPIVVASPMQLPKNTSIQKDWERMWEKRQDRGRVRSKVGSRGLFVDSIVSLFLTLTIITFIIKNVVDS